MNLILKKVTYVDNCWMWTGCVNSDGYPKLARNGDCNVKGHRYVYSVVKGEITDGQVVRHKCDNPLCLNPDHLELGSPSDNTRDRFVRGRTNNAVSSETDDKIFELRQNGLSQKKVAMVVGCSQTHISKLELGKYKFK